jgi:hypothetical protein
MYRAAFAFEAAGEEEISVVEGEILSAVQGGDKLTHLDGWLFVRKVNNATGFVPAGYMKAISQPGGISGTITRSSGVVESRSGARSSSSRDGDDGGIGRSKFRGGSSSNGGTSLRSGAKREIKPPPRFMSPTKSFLKKKVPRSEKGSRVYKVDGNKNRAIRVNDLVQIKDPFGKHRPSGHMSMGFVRYIGPTHIQPGTWFGVILDDERDGERGPSDGKIMYQGCPLEPHYERAYFMCPCHKPAVLVQLESIIQNVRPFVSPYDDDLHEWKCHTCGESNLGCTGFCLECNEPKLDSKKTHRSLLWHEAYTAPHTNAHLPFSPTQKHRVSKTRLEKDGARIEQGLKASARALSALKEGDHLLAIEASQQAIILLKGSGKLEWIQAVTEIQKEASTNLCEESGWRGNELGVDALYDGDDGEDEDGKDQYDALQEGQEEEEYHEEDQGHSALLEEEEYHEEDMMHQ